MRTYWLVGKTRTIVRELAIIALVLTDGWASQSTSRAGALCLVGVGGLRLLYLLLMVLVRRRAVLPVETLNIDLSGIRPPPMLPEMMRRRLSERFHALSAIALVGATVGVVSRTPAVLFVVVGAVLAVEIVAVAASVSWLVRSRGCTIRGRYWAAIHRRVHALAPQVMLYHTGTPDSAHQVNMWLGATENLGRSAIIALRERACFAELEPTTLPVVCIPDSVDFMTFVLPEIRVAMYTANVGKTIQMLREPGVTHVFIGHGDSDKSASFNPFSRVYTEVWVAGEAGRDRYRQARVGVRDEDIIEVGRPQLAGIEVVAEPIGDREITVLYAPTWEGWTGEPSQPRWSAPDQRWSSGWSGSRTCASSTSRTHSRGRSATKRRARMPRSARRWREAGSAQDGRRPIPDVVRVLQPGRPVGRGHLQRPVRLHLQREAVHRANLGGLDEEGFRARYPSAGAAYLLDPAGDRIGAILDLARDTDPLAATAHPQALPARSGRAGRDDPIRRRR